MDRIVLTVPARGDYARPVRMTAAELASRMGMSLDDVDDVRIAVEEAFVFVSGHAGEGSEVTFTFSLDDASLEVLAAAGQAACVGFTDDDAGSRYARFILESVCDEFELVETKDECRLRLVKRLS